MHISRTSCVPGLLVTSLFAIEVGCRPPSPPVTYPSSNSEQAAHDGSKKVAIEAYSGHQISRYGPIRVIFEQDIVPKSQVGAILHQSPFQFTPQLHGHAVWTSTRELHFQLDTPLANNQRVAAKLHLADLPKGIEASDFSFHFWPKKLSFSAAKFGWVNTAGISSYTGELTTTDRVESTTAEQILTVHTSSLSSAAPSIRWTHTNDGLKHRFFVSNLPREDIPRQFKLRFSGAPIQADVNIERAVHIPAQDIFFALNARQASDNSLIIILSDPIEPHQDFSKFVSVTGKERLRFSPEGSILRVYTGDGDTWKRSTTIVIAPGLKAAGTTAKVTSRSQTFTVRFGAKKPEVRFVGNGVIIPGKKQTSLPIETINLSHIWVEAVHIPYPNLRQFLQVNDLDGDKELVRVAKTIWRKRIDLHHSNTDRDRWVRRGLDLSELVKTHPNGLYRLNLYFTPQDTDGSCPSDAFTDVEDSELIKHLTSVQRLKESSSWDPWENGAQNYGKRFNPCSTSYYYPYHDHDIRAARNILFSDVGIIAKKGQTDDLFLAVTQLSSSQPLANAKVTIFDFAHQVLGTGYTDNQGFARLGLAKGKPFAAAVSHDQQLAVLKLTDGRALSTAHFDTGGKAVNNGIKGYIYGERGVWRPGDTIHLGFVLFDPHATLPKDYPVKIAVTNPKGQIVYKETIHAPPPIYRFNIPTSIISPTGFYYAKVAVGPVTFEKKLQVESIVPNRFKISFDLGTNQLQGPQALIQTKLQAQWLHGAPASGKKVSIELGLKAEHTAFDRYSEYSFDDPTRTFSHSPREVFTGTLDDDGTTSVQLKLRSTKSSPGMLRASFITRVFEESGQASTDRVSTRLSPYERYIGVKTPKGDKARGMLLTDVKHKAEIVAVDPHGQPVNTRVKVQLYKIRWRWWWEKGTDNLADYSSQSSHQAVASEEITITDGIGSFDFEVNYPEWGRYLILVSDLEGKHRTGKTLYIDWPGWAGRQQKETSGAAQRLTLTSDRQRVGIGKPFTVSFPSPAKGRALLSLENGTRVVSTQWLELEKETTQVTITATKDMVPNIFANVTIIQPHQDKENDRPIRMFGLTPIEVVDPQTKLHPVIEAPTEIEPTKEFTIKVTEKQGKAMSYTLAIVDEGLLGLTRFPTPNPWKHFHQREALGVRTWDLYDHVAGAYGGTLETLLAIGGGAFAPDDGSPNGLRFAPVVKVLGPFHMDTKDEDSHQITLPPYLGEVRVMVTAASSNAFGHAQTSVRVTKPLLVLSSFPRALSPQDSVMLPVTVFVTDPTLRELSVQMTTRGPASIPKESQTQTLPISGPGEHTFKFPLIVKDRAQPVTLVVSTQAGAYSHQETTTVDVLYPTLATTRVKTKPLIPQQPWQADISPVGVNGTNKYTLELSRTPPLQLGKHLDWLIAYPHGCLEQTVSKAFPQLYLGQLSALSPAEEETIRTHITATISKLRSFQLRSGAFAYWPGTDHQSHAWSNIWAGHFLLEAKSAGYAVDDEVFQSWLNHLEKQAETWTVDEQPALTQAYRIYVLTLAGRSPIGAMNRLREANPENPWVRFRLAASYALIGEKDSALALIPKDPIPFSKENTDHHTFGTILRNQAMALETYLALGDLTQASAIAEQLSQQLQSDQLSTHEISYALVALSRMSLSINHPPTPPIVRVTWQGKSQEYELTKPLLRIDLPADPNKLVTLHAENQSASPVFASLSLTGHPPAEASAGVEHGLHLVSHITRKTETIPMSAVEEGDDLVISVEVTNTLNHTIRNIALAHQVPAAMIIRNDRLDGRSLDPTLFTYQDVGDRRVHTYFDLQPGQTKTIPIRVHVQFQGRFFSAPIRAEAMYDARVYGETSSEWFEIMSASSHQ